MSMVSNIEVDVVVEVDMVRHCSWHVSSIKEAQVDGIEDAHMKTVVAEDQRERRHLIWSRMAQCFWTRELSWKRQAAKADWA